MEFKTDFNLKPYNTFGITAKTKFFSEFTSEEQLKKLLASETAKKNKLLILGGGSNILFTQHFDGLVVHNRMMNISIVEETDEYAFVEADGGVIWHDLVKFALENNLGGLENLSLIPGTVGAAPIQNIGAYGVELQEVMVSLQSTEIASGEQRLFKNQECQFGYRDSIFKHQLKDKFLITSVLFKLSKHHLINTSYGAINDVLHKRGISTPTIQDISDVVVEIRQSKLPDPAIVGNAGSFFKNPIVDKIDFEGLKLEFPGIPGYPDNGNVKVPAAWLIDQCGWKGFRRGNIGVHDQQPLVLVNFGNGDGRAIADLAIEIKEDVVRKFGIELEPEPRIL